MLYMYGKVFTLVINIFLIFFLFQVHHKRYRILLTFCTQFVLFSWEGVIHALWYMPLDTCHLIHAPWSTPLDPRPLIHAPLIHVDSRGRSPVAIFQVRAGEEDILWRCAKTPRIIFVVSFPGQSGGLDMILFKWSLVYLAPIWCPMEVCPPLPPL